ncbi:MAG: outer membrane protein [Planctomycetota bacterium]|jgi:opacity protein-like surface antigen
MKTKMMKARMCLCLLFILSAGLLSAAEAEDQWQFELTPYFWFLSIEGDATMNGVTGSVDVDFGDIWDVFNYGGLCRLDAQKDKWGFKTDVVMMDMGEDFTGPGGNRAEADVRQWAVDFVVLYEVFSTSMGADNSGKLSVSPYSGFRYNYLKQQVTLPAPFGQLGDSQDWLDLVIGSSVKMDFSEKWSANLEGDMGGFEIGSSSDLAWQIIARLNYMLTDNIGLDVGYRHTEIDYSRGSGSTGFGLDATYSGPLLGMTIKW